jgi:hypothetical protein
MMAVHPAAMAPMSGPMVSWIGKLYALRVAVSNGCMSCGGPDAPNNQRSAQRVLPDARAHESVGEGNVARLLVLCEARQVVGHPDAVVHAPRDLDEIRLKRRLAEIALACFGDERLIVLECPVQPAQLLDAKFKWACLVRQKCGAHLRGRGRNVGNGRVLEWW